MAFLFTWDATFKSQPADTEEASKGASRIRDLKNALTERLQVDHSWTGTANDGKHLKVTLPIMAGNPSNIADTGILYTKTAGAGSELFYINNVGTIVQITAGGYLTTALNALSAGLAASMSGKTTVASSATPDIFAAANGYLIDYTGAVTATGFVAASTAGMTKRLYLAGAAAFTAGANLLIEGHTSGQTVTLAAGAVVDVFAITTTQFKLSYTLSGSFTATGTGFTVNPTGTAIYTYSNGVVTLYIPQLSGTSNSVSFTVSGIPAVIGTPASAIYTALIAARDNGSAVTANGSILSGVLSLLINAGVGTWTSSGTKTLYATTLTYRMI